MGLASYTARSSEDASSGTMAAPPSPDAHEAVNRPRRPPAAGYRRLLLPLALLAVEAATLRPLLLLPLQAAAVALLLLAAARALGRDEDNCRTMETEEYGDGVAAAEHRYENGEASHIRPSRVVLALPRRCQLSFCCYRQQAAAVTNRGPRQNWFSILHRTPRFRRIFRISPPLSMSLAAAWKLCLPLAHLTAARRASAFSPPSHASTYLRYSSRNIQRGFASMSDAAGIKSVVVIVAMEGACIFLCLASAAAVPRAPVGARRVTTSIVRVWLYVRLPHIQHARRKRTPTEGGYTCSVCLLPSF